MRRSEVRKFGCTRIWGGKERERERERERRKKFCWRNFSGKQAGWAVILELNFLFQYSSVGRDFLFLVNLICWGEKLLKIFWKNHCKTFESGPKVTGSSMLRSLRWNSLGFVSGIGTIFLEYLTFVWLHQHSQVTIASPLVDLTRLSWRFKPIRHEFWVILLLPMLDDHDHSSVALILPLR